MNLNRPTETLVKTDKQKNMERARGPIYYQRTLRTHLLFCVAYEKKAHLAFNNFCLILVIKLVFRQNQRILVDVQAKTLQKVKKSNKTRRIDFEKKNAEKKIDEKKFVRNKDGKTNECCFACFLFQLK